MESLGIDPKLLFAQIVNFSILLFLLSKFVYAPLKKIMKERQEKIAQGVSFAESMEEKERQMQERFQKLIDQAGLQAAKILTETKEKAKIEREEILRLAQEEAKKTMQEGLAILEAKREEDLMKLQEEIAQTVVILAEKILKENLDKERQRKIIAQKLEELEKIHVEG